MLAMLRGYQQILMPGIMCTVNSYCPRSNKDEGRLKVMGCLSSCFEEKGGRGRERKGKWNDFIRKIQNRIPSVLIVNVLCLRERLGPSCGFCVVVFLFFF